MAIGKSGAMMNLDDLSIKFGDLIIVYKGKLIIIIMNKMHLII